MQKVFSVSPTYWMEDFLHSVRLTMLLTRQSAVALTQNCWPVTVLQNIAPLFICIHILQRGWQHWLFPYTCMWHSSCLSSPPSFCIRLVFFCVFISALFPLLFTALHLTSPSLHAWIFYRKFFYPSVSFGPFKLVLTKRSLRLGGRW